ncbi:DUF4113 domain-containing protein [Aeromonas caviae]|uniref:DUF4113 domain-containing protein n=1 Tax=Aeromonas caviae TaxID=648 RepID=UPI0030813326|nr:DUF4113 domain-containing protein [Aeromonas caviae]
MHDDFPSVSMHQGRQPDPRNETLMKVIDQINQGSLGKAYFAARGRNTREWMMKREQLSPRYTTCINELPAVKA